MVSEPRDQGSAIIPAVILLLAAAGVSIFMVALVRESAPRALASGPSLTFELVTTPAGAMAFFDGRFIGPTPAQLDGVEEGAHMVRIEKTGYIPQRRRVVVSAGAQRVEVELDPVPTGKLDIKSEPSGAEVYVDGEFRGLTPLVAGGLIAGNHVVLLRKTNHLDVSVAAAVKAGQTAPVSGTLENRIEKYLQAAIAAQPEAIPPWTDYAHWLFISDRMDDAIEAYTKGIELSSLPDAKKKDVQRHDKEIKKHYGWPGVDTSYFRRKMADK